MNNFLSKNEYHLASTKRIVFARFCDLILVSIFPLVLDVTSTLWGWSQPAVAFFMIVVTLLWLSVYFVLIPYFWHGKTLAKWMLRMTLIAQQNNLTWTHLWARELFITYIPWFVILLSNVVIAFFLHSSAVSALTADHWSWTIIVLRLSALFYIMWYCGLWFGIAFDDNRQFFIDAFFKLYLVRLKPKTQPFVRKQRETTKHIHLGDHQPGMISWQEENTFKPEHD